MRPTRTRTKGWPRGHPFFVLLLAIACSPTTSSPPAPAARPACGAVALANSHRFALTPIETGLPKSGQWRDGFDLADMDGDGHVDLAHGPPRKGRGQPVIFLGDGRGHFDLWGTTSFPPLPYDYGDVKVADVNGDGAMDIALAAHLRGLTVLIYEGGGHYAPWAAGLDLVLQGMSDRAPFTSRRIAVIDWNLDKKPDLLALNEGPGRLASAPRATEAFALYLNRGGFWDSIAPTQSLHLFGSTMDTGDVNGDGHPDAILGTESAGARLVVMLGRNEGWMPRELRSLPAGAAITAVAAHDFDGHRRAAIVAGTRYAEGDHYCTALDVVRWREDSETVSYLWSESSRNAVVTVAAADFDRDGYDDLAVIRRQGTMMLFAGDAGGFTRDATVDCPEWLSGCHAYDAHAVDLDGDGRPEILVSFAGEASASGERCSSGGGFAAWRVASSDAGR